MEKKELESSDSYESYDLKTRFAFSVGEITDTAAYQGFQVIVFVLGE